MAKRDSEGERECVGGRAPKFVRFNGGCESRTLLLGLNELRVLDRKTSLCDVTIVVGDNEYPAHRAVLAASSNVFHNMFTNGMRETRESRIVLKEMSSDVWEAVMKIVYTNNSYFSDVKDALRVLFCARRFEVAVVEQRVCHFLLEHLTDILRGILSSENLLVKSEKEVFDAIVCWSTGYSSQYYPTHVREKRDAIVLEENRKQKASNLFKLIRLCQVPNHEVQNIIETAKQFPDTENFIAALNQKLCVPHFPGIRLCNKHHLPYERRTMKTTITFPHFGILREKGHLSNHGRKVHSPWVGNGSGIFWRLAIVPKGIGGGENKFVSVFVLHEDTRREEVKSEEDAVQAQLFLIKPTVRSNHLHAAWNITLTEYTEIRNLDKHLLGESKFISLDEIRNKREGYVDAVSGSVMFGATIYFKPGLRS